MWASLAGWIMGAGALLAPSAEESTFTPMFRRLAGGAFMAAKEIVAAIQRVEDVLRRRPEVGLHDAPASVHWQGGTRVVASYAGGMTMTTDMPCALGSSGDQATRGQAR